MLKQTNFYCHNCSNQIGSVTEVVWGTSRVLYRLTNETLQTIVQTANFIRTNLLKSRVSQPISEKRFPNNLRMIYCITL